MYFADIENPFGTAATVAPTTADIKVRPHRLPKTKKSAVTKFLRNPTAPSTIVKNFLLS